MVRGVGEKAEKTEGRGGARRIFKEDNHGAFILDIGIHIGIQFGPSGIQVGDIPYDRGPSIDDHGMLGALWILLKVARVKQDDRAEQGGNLARE